MGKLMGEANKTHASGRESGEYERATILLSDCVAQSGSA
jgi:hypothetical protein